MIRLILRDLFPGRSAVGALRSRIAELEHENKSLGEAYARVNVYNRNLNEECDRLISERDDARGDVEKLSAEVDALTKRAPDPAPFVPEDGGECPDRTCTGTLRWTRVGDCSCHISPPCGPCTSSPLVCDECGWRTE